MAEALRIGIAGLGTVGAAVARFIEQKQSELTDNADGRSRSWPFRLAVGNATVASISQGKVVRRSHDLRSPTASTSSSS